jgi:hypothetical protein
MDMIRPALVTLSLVVGLSGCARLAESRLNPLNWFGRSVEVTATDPAQRRPLVTAAQRSIEVDGRLLVPVVTELTIDRTSIGAIVRATGIAPTQGYFNAELVEVGTENGVLVYDFRIEAPQGFQVTGNEATRRISAAEDLSNADLAGIRAVRVRGADNAREARR